VRSLQTIYLDYNATTPIAPTVLEAMQPFLTRFYGNPSSDHSYGRATYHAVEEAREKVAAMLGAVGDEIVFTAGGTESNNLAMIGAMRKHSPFPGGHVVISSIEHPATSAPARYLEQNGFDVTVCPCDSNGLIHVDSVKASLREDTRLVSVMHANNEIGTIQPIREIVQCCRPHGVLVHTDAAQSVGKVPINVVEMGVDLLSMAGHKFYAPKGVGALYIRRGVDVRPILFGAGHESGLRPGTENVPFIVAIGAAAELAARGSHDTHERLTRLRDRLVELLRERFGQRLVVHGEPVPRLPNTLSASFPGVSGRELLGRTPELCASVGSACHGGDSVGSTTLQAMGVSRQAALGTVRLSMGWPTSIDEVEKAAGLLKAAWDQLAS